MTKTTKGIVTVSVIAVLGFGAYRLFYKTKRQKVKYLIEGNYSQGTEAELMAFGDDYIDAWYKAAKDGRDSFALGTGMYHTKGGTAK